MATPGIGKKIKELITLGWNCQSYMDYDRWVVRVESFLTSGVDPTVAQAFSNARNSYAAWEHRREQQIGHLEGLALKLDAPDSTGSAMAAKNPPPPTPTASAKKVFVVHGHDNEAKEAVARFVERVGLEPIILHEQPSSGRTLIEKFEVLSDVGFAIVLLTPDDIGKSANAEANLQGRARQNVILELGYFMGKLTRKKVCALFKAGVEIPSDYQGILYVEFDKAGAWKTKLAQELIEAGYSINIEALIRG